jgi:hypothetical protein
VRWKSTFAAVVAVALAGAGTVLLLPRSAADDYCLDAAGHLAVPDGLVLDGPEDNRAHEPFASYLAACPLRVEHTQQTVGVPYREVVDSWLACLRSSLVTMEESNREAGAAPPATLGPRPEGLGAQPARACGPAPDPLSTDPDGFVRRDVAFTTLHGPRASIAFSTHTLVHLGMERQAGRVSTVFWGHGSLAEAMGRLTASSHWEDGAHHPEGCGDPRYVLRGASPHVATWATSEDLEAHHGGPNCLEDRYHLRIYDGGSTQGWGRWSVANVHFDADWHSETPGNPGVDHLHEEHTAFAAAHMRIWSSALGVYVHAYKLP